MLGKEVSGIRFKSWANGPGREAVAREGDGGPVSEEEDSMSRSCM